MDRNGYRNLREAHTYRFNTNCLLFSYYLLESKQFSPITPTLIARELVQ